MTRAFVILALLLMVVPVTRASELAWSDAARYSVEGRALGERAAEWDRLPAEARGVVRDPVWDLSRHSAGIAVRFITDSTSVGVRWKLISPKLAMPHMASTGVSGVDLYVKVGERWRWVACGVPEGIETTRTLASGLPPESREWMLYLPLYNGVESIEIGVDENASIGPATGRGKPVVFYGTSITQGACASRPGMSHVAMLGRRIDRPVVNLGFSGNGRMEPEVGRFVAEIDASVFVIDCLPNLDGRAVAERTMPLVTAIRERRPGVPIVLVEDRTYADAPFSASRSRRNTLNREALRRAWTEMTDAGMKNIHLVDGETLLGDDGEATVDGSHPTDLGFARQADALEPIIRECLEEGSGR